MRVRERRPEHRIQAQTSPQKERKLGWVKQGWKARRRQGGFVQPANGHKT
jgi:hypothetical protein